MKQDCINSASSQGQPIQVGRHCCKGGAFRNGGWQRGLSLTLYHSFCSARWVKGTWCLTTATETSRHLPSARKHREHGPCSTPGHIHTQVRPYFRILESYIRWNTYSAIVVEQLRRTASLKHWNNLFACTRQKVSTKLIYFPVPHSPFPVSQFFHFCVYCSSVIFRKVPHHTGRQCQVESWKSKYLAADCNFPKEVGDIKLLF